MRILFVDDEQDVLDGIKNRLRRYRKVWTIDFAAGGFAALEKLEEQSYDVIVSDMRMPGMDGAELLNIVREKYGHMIRLVLTGQTEKERMLRALSVAHKILSKPCDAEVLESAINQVANLKTKIDDVAIRNAVAALKGLPSLPGLHKKLTEVVEREDFNLQDVARVLEVDSAMTARILQIVNSSFFGLNRNVTCVLDAISYMGLSSIRCVVLSVELFESLKSFSPDLDFSLDEMHDHALKTAVLAKKMLSDPDHIKTAFSAAIVHDIGSLVLTVISAAGKTDRNVESCSIEGGHGDCLNHAAIGAYLLSLWDLPFSIVEAVAYHHKPSLSSEASFAVVGAVHVADQLLHSMQNDPNHNEFHEASLDQAYIERVGIESRLPEWALLAKEVLENATA